MRDSKDLIKAIKRAAAEAVEASKPVAVCFGRVTSVAPLSILVDQKLPITAKQIVTTRNVTDYETDTSNRERAGEKTGITIHNQLAAGDEVILLRQQGGQRYVVLERIG